MKALIQESIKIVQDIMRMNPIFREHLEIVMSSATYKIDQNDPGRLADFICLLTSSGSKKELMEAFSERDGYKRLQLGHKLLLKEFEISEAQMKIRHQVDSKVQSQQREFFLREQLKAIKKELGYFFLLGKAVKKVG